MEIKEIATYLMDTGEGLLIGGYRENGIVDEERSFLSTKLEKLFTSSQRKEATLPSHAWILEQLRAYQNQEMSFMQFSEKVGRQYYACKREWNLFMPSSLVIALVSFEQAHYLLLCDQSYKSSFQCSLDDHQQAVCTPQKILSNTLLKSDFGFTISLGDHAVHIYEQKQKKGYVLSENFLEADLLPSYAEVQKVMDESVRGLSEKYEMDITQALTKMKQLTKDHVQEQEELLVEEVAEEVFHEVPYAADEFCALMKQHGIRDTIPLESVKIRKSLSMQQIKTDTGVEITFPVEYMNESDKLEIKHESGGTILISIKNVTHIQNR